MGFYVLLGIFFRRFQMRGKVEEGKGEGGKNDTINSHDSHEEKEYPYSKDESFAPIL